MKLTVLCDTADRTRVRLKETHSMCAGDIYSPLVFENVRGADTGTLNLSIIRPDTRQTVAYATAFDAPSDSVRRTTLAMNTVEIAKWYAEKVSAETSSDESDAESVYGKVASAATETTPAAVTETAVLRLSDAYVTFAEAEIPVILRQTQTAVVRGIDGLSATLTLVRGANSVTMTARDVNGVTTATVYDGDDASWSVEDSLTDSANPVSARAVAAAVAARAMSSDLQTLAGRVELAEALLSSLSSRKEDRVAGKGLSSNDYTDSDADAVSRLGALAFKARVASSDLAQDVSSALDAAGTNAASALAAANGLATSKMSVTDYVSDGRIAYGKLPADIARVSYPDALPPAGEQRVLYVTPSGVYRWTGQGFVPLSSQISVGTSAGDAYDGAAGAALAIAVATMQSQLTQKAELTDIVSLTAGLAGKADLVSGKVPGSQLPPKADLVSGKVPETQLPPKADLVDGKVPATQLPEVPEEVVECSDSSGFPEEGGKLFVSRATGKVYRRAGGGFAGIVPELDLGAYALKSEMSATPGDGKVTLQLRSGVSATVPTGHQRLAARGLTAWTVKRDGTDVTSQLGSLTYMYFDEPFETYAWSSMDGEILVPGDSKPSPLIEGDEGATWLTWTANDEYDYTEHTYVATRTELPGLQLGDDSDSDHALAAISEMSVEPGTGANADKATIRLRAGLGVTVLTAHQDVNGKANRSELSYAYHGVSAQNLQVVDAWTVPASFFPIVAGAPDNAVSGTQQTDSGTSLYPPDMTSNYYRLSCPDIATALGMPDFELQFSSSDGSFAGFSGVPPSSISFGGVSANVSDFSTFPSLVWVDYGITVSARTVTEVSLPAGKTLRVTVQGDPMAASAKPRGCVLVVNCASGAASSVVWDSHFHPRTSRAADFGVIAPGKRSVFRMSEYARGEFVVDGWQETEGGT